MPERRSTVGAGLLAKAVCQITLCQLIHRIREQARSHKGMWCLRNIRPHHQIHKRYRRRTADISKK